MILNMDILLMIYMVVFLTLFVHYLLSFYLVDDNDFIKNIYIMKDNIPEKHYSKIIIGVSTYNQSARSAGRKVSRLKKMNFKNISIFSYNTMSKKPYYWKRLKKYF